MLAWDEGRADADRLVRARGHRPAGLSDRPVQPALHILHARRGLDWLPRAGLLTDEELVRLITIAVTRGPGSSFTRITGPASAPGVATTSSW